MKAMIAAFAISLTLATPFAIAAHGKFPGKGRYSQWIKSRQIYDRADAARKSAQLNEAIRLYDLAIQTYPYDTDFYGDLAALYENDKKDYDKAAQLFKKAMQADPTDIEAKIGYAGALIDQDKLSQAESVLNSIDRKHLNRRDAELVQTGFNQIKDKQNKKL